MTYQDYINWANEYQQEADMLEKVIDKKKQEYDNERRHYEKMIIGRTLKRLEDQKSLCFNTARMLESKARAIREKEG